MCPCGHDRTACILAAVRMTTVILQLLRPGIQQWDGVELR